MASKLGRFGKEALSKWGKHGHRQYAKNVELFPQRLVLPDVDHGYVPTLSPQQVTSLLTVNETQLENSSNTVVHEIKGYESNQLGSNFPCEDRRRQARLLHTSGTLFGVFDGHGGLACAQAVSERLFEYIAISLLSAEKLEQFSHSLKTDSGMELLHWHLNNNDYTNEEMSTLYRNSLHKFVIESLSLSGLQEFESDEKLVGHALETAFIQLDNDMSAEALPSGGNINLEALEVGLSGACATVAHISDLNVHVASMGDTRAVLGQLDDNGNWVAKAMSNDHNTSSEAEVARLKSAHPISEHNFIIKGNRLLGQLIPTRAFGDFRYKWTLQDLKSVVKIIDNPYVQSLIPMNYYTPPYLINTPEVSHHKLTPNDRFLVIASDGLWDMLSNDQVVQLVGEFIEGKETAEHFKLHDRTLPLGNINDQLRKRKHGLANKSMDSNSATHLIRHALGKEHRKVSEMLTITPEVVRYYRDDISVTVVFFDNRYIQERINECIPDHLTQLVCEDGRCIRFKSGYKCPEHTCYREGDTACDNQIQCYYKHFDFCDGKFDCEDQSDESHCEIQVASMPLPNEVMLIIVAVTAFAIMCLVITLFVYCRRYSRREVAADNIAGVPPGPPLCPAHMTLPRVPCCPAHVSAVQSLLGHNGAASPYAVPEEEPFVTAHSQMNRQQVQRLKIMREK